MNSFFMKLFKKWSDEQGYKTWSQDHAAVLRNLAQWLDSHVEKNTLATDVLPRNNDE